MTNWNLPKRVDLADITVRDGFQHEEKWIPTEAKLWVLEELDPRGLPAPRGDEPREPEGDAAVRRLRRAAEGRSGRASGSRSRSPTSS